MKNIHLGLIALLSVLSVSSLWAQQPCAVAERDSANTTKLCDLAELDTPPKPIKRTQPLYPAELKTSRITGEAILSFVVDVDGSVKNLNVEKATDHAFGEAALAAVATWKFEPGLKNGVPVRCRLSVPLRFALSN